MRDGWLGKDLSTAPEDLPWKPRWVNVSVRVHYVSVKKHKAARGTSRGNSLREIKVAGSYQEDKCRSVEPYSIVHKNSCWLLHLLSICY